MTQPPTSSWTTDVAAAAHDTDAVKGTLPVTGDTCTRAAPGTTMATHVITALEPTSTPPSTLSSKTQDKAAATDGDAEEGVLVWTADTCTKAAPVTMMAKHLMTLLAATTTPPPTSSPTTAENVAANDQDASNGVVVATGDS